MQWNLNLKFLYKMKRILKFKIYNYKSFKLQFEVRVLYVYIYIYILKYNNADKKLKKKLNSIFI